MNCLKLYFLRMKVTREEIQLINIRQNLRRVILMMLLLISQHMIENIIWFIKNFTFFILIECIIFIIV